MRRAILLAGIAVLTAAMAPAPFARKVSDESLAAMRGGFALPGGIEVALAVTTDTIVNGAIVLRSELRVATGPSEISVFVPRAGETAMSAHGSMSGEGASSSADMPNITYTPQEGISVIPRAPGFNVSIGGRAPSVPTELPAGLEQVDLAPGDAASVAGGTVSLERMGLASRVRLEGDSLATTHFYGDAIGSLTVNTGSGRTIDSITTINLDLANISPDVIGSSLFRTEAAALEATRMLSQ